MDFNNMIVRCSGLNEAYEALRLVEAYTDITWEDGDSPVKGGENTWTTARHRLSINDELVLFFKHYSHVSETNVYFRSKRHHHSSYINDLCVELENPRVVDFNEFAAFLTGIDKIMPSGNDLISFLIGDIK